MPPAIWFSPPPWVPMGASACGSNGFACPRLHREWPGWVNVYRRAVESASESRLNALAVYALAFAMAWLPGHTWLGSAWEFATAQIFPSRFTTATHIRVP